MFSTYEAQKPMIPYDPTLDYLDLKFKVDDSYWKQRREWKNSLRDAQWFLHYKVYGKAPEWAFEQMRMMKAEEKLEYIPLYLDYLIAIKEGNRIASQSKLFLPQWDIREELGFEHWLAVYFYCPSNLLPTPNWDKVRPAPKRPEIEVHEWGFSSWVY